METERRKQKWFGYILREGRGWVARNGRAWTSHRVEAEENQEQGPIAALCGCLYVPSVSNGSKDMSLDTAGWQFHTGR
jgi:hypothetical protein